MSSRSLARQRKRLWQENPRCYYCGVETILGPQHLKGEWFRPEIRARLATIDHIRPRHHPDRGKRPEPGERLHVLACWKCNNERDHRERAALPKEYHWQKCGSLPLSERPTEEIRATLEMLRARPPYRSSKRKQWRASLAAIEAELARRMEQDDEEIWA